MTKKNTLHSLTLVLFLFLANSVFGQKILDAGQLTTTSTAAYSIRQLKTTYSHNAITPPAAVSGFTNSTTPLVRVRRSSDNGQLDIGYLASGELDTVTLKSFVSSGSGYISVWYDQSGSSRDVTQGTASRQPRIVNAGAVERSNGKPSIRFISGANYAASSNLTRTINATTLFDNGLIGSAMAVFEASSGNASAWGFGDNNNRWQIHANEGGGLKFDYGNAYQRTSYTNTQNEGVLKNYAFIAPSGQGGQIWVNGVLVSTGQTPSNPCSGTLFEIGGIQQFNNWNHNDHQSELILFNSALGTIDRSAVSDDQAAFFLGLYIWSGATSSDYSIATNWRSNSLPSLANDIYISALATNPLTVSNIYQVRNMTVEAGATVTLASGGNLQVSGNMIHGGIFTGVGTLTFNGTTAQTLGGDNGVYGNVNINNAAGIVVPGSTVFNGLVTFTSGSMDASNYSTNPVFYTTVELNGGVSGSSVSNTIRGSTQTDLVWGGDASGTVFLDQTTNNNTNAFRNLTINGTQPMLLGSNGAIVGGNITVNVGAQLDIQTFTLNRSASSGTLTVNGILKLGANTGGQAGSNYPNNFTSPPTMGTNGMIEYNGSNAITQTVFATTYTNLKLSNGSATGNAAKVSTGNIVVNTGSFNVDTLTTFTPAAANTISGSGTLTGKGKIIANRTTGTTDFNSQYSISNKTLTGLTVEYNSASAQTVNIHTYGNLIFSGAGTATLGGAIIVNGNLTISAGTLTIPNNTNRSITLGGNWINNGTFTHSSTDATSAVIFNGINQTISGSSATTFHRLTISSTGVTTLAQNIAITDVANATLTISVGSTLDLATFTANSANNRTLTVSGTLRLGSSSGGQTGSNYPTGYNSNGTLNAGSVVEYNGANDITQTVFARTYQNLTLTNGSGIGIANKISTASFAVNTGNFTVNVDAQFTPAATNIISGTGTLTGYGTIDVTHVSENLTTQYTLNRDTTNLSVNTYETISSSSIPSGTYGNLNLTRGNTQTLQGNIIVTGNLTISSGTTLDVSNNNNYSITIAGNWINNGDFNDRDGTVTFNGVNQIIGGSVSTTFRYLVISSGETGLNVNTTIARNATISSGATLNIGTYTFDRGSAGGVIVVAGTLKLSAASNFPANFDTRTMTGGTVIYNGLNNVTQTISNLPTYNNLTITNGSGSGNAAKISSGGFAVSGVFRIDTLTTFTPAAADVISGSGTINGNGTVVANRATATTDFNTQYSISTKSLGSLTVNYARNNTQTINPHTYGNLIISGGAGTKTLGGAITVNGDITISTGTTLATNNNNIAIAGNWQHNGGTFTPGTGTVTFNGATQTIGGGIATTFHALTVSSSVSTTLLNNVSLANVNNANLTVSGGTTFDLGTFTCNRLGTTGTNRILTINGALKLGANTGGQTGSNFPSNFGTVTLTGGTVDYYRSNGGQTIYSATYNNLLVSNTSGTQTAGGNLTINGQLSINGTTLNMSTFTLSGASLTTTGSGTIQTQNTSGTPLPSGRNWDYTVEYNSGSLQTIVAGNYVNLVSGNGNRTLASSGTIGVSGAFTTGSGTYTVTGSTVDFNGTGVQTIPAISYNNLSVSGTRVGNPSLILYPGIINIAGNFTNTATGLGTFFTSGSTVNYNGGIQTVAGIGYGKLVISGTDLKTLGGNTTVNDSLIVSGTNGLNGSSYNLTVVGPWLNNTAFNGASGTVVFAGFTAQSVSGTSTPAFFGLTLNNSAGLALNASTTVNGGLTLVNGKITIGSNTLTLNGNVSSSASNCIISNGSSNLTFGGSVNSTIHVDQTTPGTTNRFATVTVNCSGSTVSMGNNLQVSTALNITSGKLGIGANTLTLNGTLSNSSGNCISANGNSNLTINGSGALGTNLFFDQTTPGTTNRLADFTINRSGGTITIGDTLEVANVLTSTTGTLATNNRLKLISNAAGTARVAQVTGTITGNVSVERFVPATARRWRFFGSPVSGSTLADLKNETYITGVGGAANGFDSTLSNQAGVYSYNETVITGNLNTGWTAATNITNALTVGKGYRIFIRGDRSDIGRLNGTVATQNAVTVNFVGPLNIGNIPIPVTFTSSGTPANDGWNLVANPYASPIDWNNFHDAGRGGTDPNFSGTDYARLSPIIYIYSAATGSYVSYNAISDAGTGVLSSGIIPSGAAFWVQTTAASPSMTMKEIYKVSGVPAAVFKTTSDPFRVILSKDSITNDEFVLKYDEAATDEQDVYDIKKMFGSEVDISSKTLGGHFLSLNCKPFHGYDSIPLSIGLASSGTYTLSFSDKSKLGIGAQYSVFLMDRFTQNITDLGVESAVTFTANLNDSASYGNGRFAIVVKETVTGTPEFGDDLAQGGFYVYPTVTADYVTVYSRQPVDSKTEIQLVNEMGMVVDLNNQTWNGRHIELDLSHYQSGVYFVRIIRPGYSTQVLKCIKL